MHLDFDGYWSLTDEQRDAVELFLLRHGVDVHEVAVLECVTTVEHLLVLSPALPIEWLDEGDLVTRGDAYPLDVDALRELAATGVSW